MVDFYENCDIVTIILQKVRCGDGYTPYYNYGTTSTLDDITSYSHSSIIPSTPTYESDVNNSSDSSM